MGVPNVRRALRPLAMRSRKVGGLLIFDPGERNRVALRRRLNDPLRARADPVHHAVTVTTLREQSDPAAQR